MPSHNMFNRPESQYSKLSLLPENESQLLKIENKLLMKVNNSFKY